MFFPRSCFFAVTAYSIIVFERFSKENLYKKKHSLNIRQYILTFFYVFYILRYIDILQCIFIKKNGVDEYT